MIQHAGFFWPEDVADTWRHSLMHVKSIEDAIARCKQRRTAVQAGGNIGLWPKRLSEVFVRVITFEPEPISRACVVANVPANVEVRAEALGAAAGACAIKRRGLGSHRVQDGDSVTVLALDDLNLQDVDLLQLDIEGYEHHALIGARQTIARCLPIVQVELRGHTEKYGTSDAALRAELARHGYREVSRQQGSDVVFQVGA